MRKFLPLFILVMAALAAVTMTTRAAEPLPYVPGEVIVRMKSPYAAAASRAPRGFAAIASSPAGDYIKVTPKPGQSVEEAVAELGLNAEVEFAQPNYIYRGLTVTPNDTYFSQQYHLSLIGAPQAWDITKGSASETIAILDSGTDTTLLDLAARIVKVTGADIIDGDSDPSDTPSGSGHGTGVAGVAAAITNNAYNVSGVDWNSNLMIIRVLSGASAVGTSETIDSGIRRAITENATVINLSLGFSGASLDNLIEARITEAYNKGIIIAAAAGNDGTSPVIYPASSPYVIGVGASTSSDQRAYFSNYGAQSGLTGIDVMAPGYGIYTLALSGGVQSASGTSYSAPIVSAAAALAKSVRPQLTPAQFVTYLGATATDIGDVGYDDYTGWGRINLFKLLKVLSAQTNYGDSLPVADTKTSIMASQGRQALQALMVTSNDSFAGFIGRHFQTRGTIQFFWTPDSTQPTDTAFIITQKGNNARSNGNMDLIYRSDRKIECRFQDSGTIVSSTICNPGQWYHLAVTYGESGTNLWINGESEAVAAVSGAPPAADTLYFGAPKALSNAESARGKVCSLAFSGAQSQVFPSALTASIESHKTTGTEVSSARVSWKAFSSDTNPILVDIFVDTDNQGYDGTLLISGTANDFNESVSLSSLEVGKNYYFYVVATDSSTKNNIFPEKAYAYASAYFMNSTPPTVYVTGSAGSSGGGCILSNLEFGGGLLRSLRDLMMHERIGRIIAELYYFCFGTA